MIGIVDYGVGNLFSVVSSLRHIGFEAIISSDRGKLDKCDKLILPGVGAFGDASERLFASGLDKAVLSAADDGKPVLGICLGMQLLFEQSYEFGIYKGLGIIKGSIRNLRDVTPPELKIPQMGWNALHFTENNDEIFKYVNENGYVYFVHSFYGTDCDASLTAYADYGVRVTAAVRNKNVRGVQFHPEKSGDVGLNILRGFGELI